MEEKSGSTTHKNFTAACGLQKWLTTQIEMPTIAAAAAAGQGATSLLPPRSNRAATCPTRKQKK